MKITTNTINYLAKTQLSSEELSDKIGSQLGGIEEVIDIGKKYEGVIIAKVVSCVDHPNADKLHVCLIDDGGIVKEAERNEKGLVTVVCGAPNVREGLLVAWLPPGSTVPDSVDKEPFVLSARDLRGVVSNGMLASPKELAIGDNHDGILEIDGEHQPGESFADAFGLKGEVVIDIENKMFTHRPDCFGWLGIAREVAGINHIKFTSPDWLLPAPQAPAIEADILPLKIVNELPELVHRFMLISMSSIEVKPSPLWLQIELVKVGLRPINNVVDLTNYFMFLTSQPLHAYDYDKLKALSSGDTPTIVVRNPRPSEKIKLLNGKEIEPRAEGIMIATDSNLIGLAGIMGGSESEVDDNTKNIVIECGTFDMYSVRRTSMEHGLFTDASTRFTKGQSPMQNQSVIIRIVEDMRSICGGHVSSELLDDNHIGADALSRASMHPEIKVSAEFINLRLGSKLSLDEMQTLLTNVEFSVSQEDGELKVLAPFWRTDIELREDVVEEIGRLLGYDELPFELPKRDVSPVNQDKYLQLKSVIRTLLKQAGANEVLSYSFVDKDLITRLGQDPSQAYELSNALSPDLEFYRISLTPSLLSKVRPNTKSGYSKFVIYELGKTHIVDQMVDNEPVEYERLALVFSDSKKADSQTEAYYSAKYYLETLLNQLNVPGKLSYEQITDANVGIDISSQLSLYLPGRAALIKLEDKYIGVVGEYKESVHRALKLPEKVAGFELDILSLVDSFSLTPEYTPISTFPKVMQDITLKVPISTAYKVLYDEIDKAVSELKPKECTYELEALDIYQKDEQAEDKNISLRLIISSYERTLTDKQVNELLDAASERVHASLGAERI